MTSSLLIEVQSELVTNAFQFWLFHLLLKHTCIRCGLWLEMLNVWLSIFKDHFLRLVPRDFRTLIVVSLFCSGWCLIGSEEYVTGICCNDLVLNFYVFSSYVVIWWFTEFYMLPNFPVIIPSGLIVKKWSALLPISTCCLVDFLPLFL